ncbi:hypothetical protein Vretimale_5463 [Volvox reticuliferus]|uniref:Uncharacterized protein n=1 Tax=Volvox reticuliferus TaxID=1737510 RepID=A0A8J4G5D7_9CHLO|nr:hypothetical protein Vretifemale_3741 [Volvox reticuliferus]GIM00317.1 hypothetical protein Vretimale_5463 [Volvox reticuliferus]
MSLLGKGGLATVVRISDQYALKVLSDVRAAEEEATILDVLGQSSTVVGFHGRLGEEFGASLQHTALLLELCQGSISDLLSGLRSQRLPDPTGLTAQQYVVMMVNCLAQLHSRGVIHQDIKPSNFLFGRDGSVKLCDFNLSRLASDPTRPSSGGTVLYFSPQKFASIEEGYAADWWALGVTLYQLLHGLQTWPFSSRSLGRLARIPAEEQLTWVRKAVHKGNLKFRPLSGLPRAARTLIRGLLHPQSDLRWGLLQVLAGDYPADQAFSAVALRYPHLASDMERLLAVRRLCRSGSSPWQPVSCTFEEQAVAVAGTQRELNPRCGRACHSLRAFSSCLLSGRKSRDKVAMASVTVPAAAAAAASPPRRADDLPSMSQLSAKYQQQQQPLRPDKRMDEEQMERYASPYKVDGPDTSRSGGGVGPRSNGLVLTHSPETPAPQQLAPLDACSADLPLFFEQRRKVRCFTGALTSALEMRKTLLPRSDAAARAAAAVAAVAPPPLLLTPDGRLVAAPFVPCEIRTHVVDLAAVYRVLTVAHTVAGPRCEDSGPQNGIARVQGSSGGGQVQGVEVLEEMRVMLERRRLSAHCGVGSGNGVTSQTSDRSLQKAARRASCCETASTLALAPEGCDAVAMRAAARRSSPGRGMAETTQMRRDDSGEPAAAVEVVNAQHTACGRSSRHSYNGGSSSGRPAEPSLATHLSSWQQRSPIAGDSKQGTAATIRRSAPVTGFSKEAAEKVLADAAAAAFNDSEAARLSAVAAAEVLSPFTRRAHRRGLDGTKEVGGMSPVSYTAITSAAPRRRRSFVDYAQLRGFPAEEDASSGPKGNTQSAQSITAMSTSCPQSLLICRAAAATALAGHEKRQRCLEAYAFHAPPLQLPLPLLQQQPFIGSVSGSAVSESQVFRNDGCGPHQGMGRRSGSCSCAGCSDDLAGGDGGGGGMEDGSSLFSLPLGTVRSDLEASRTGASTRAAALASEGSPRKARSAFTQPQLTGGTAGFACPGPFGAAAAAVFGAAALAAAAPEEPRSTWMGKVGSVLSTRGFRRAFVFEEGKAERRSWGSGTTGDLGFCTAATPVAFFGSVDDGADGAAVSRCRTWQRLQRACGLAGTADAVAVSSDPSVPGMRPAATAVSATAAISGTPTNGMSALPSGEQLLMAAAAATGAVATPPSPSSAREGLPALIYTGRSPHSTTDADDGDTTSAAMRSSAPTAGDCDCRRHGHGRRIQAQRMYGTEGGGDGDGGAAVSAYRSYAPRGSRSNRLCRFQSRGLLRSVKQWVA